MGVGVVTAEVVVELTIQVLEVMAQGVVWVEVGVVSALLEVQVDVVDQLTLVSLLLSHLVEDGLFRRL